jgi:hypothetical protein
VSHEHFITFCHVTVDASGPSFTWQMNISGLPLNASFEQPKTVCHLVYEWLSTTLAVTWQINVSVLSVTRQYRTTRDCQSQGKYSKYFGSTCHAAVSNIQGLSVPWQAIVSGILSVSFGKDRTTQDYPPRGNRKFLGLSITYHINITGLSVTWQV